MISLITAATIGLALSATGNVLTGVRIYVQHQASKKSREVIKQSASKISQGLINATKEIKQFISKAQPFNDLFAGHEYLNQASLCISDENAIELTKCAHNHFTDGLVGILRISDLTNEEKESVCQAMVGDAMCCYYLKEPVMACKRLYESILYRPGADLPSFMIKSILGCISDVFLTKMALLDESVNRAILLKEISHKRFFLFPSIYTYINDNSIRAKIIETYEAAKSIEKNSIGCDFGLLEEQKRNADIFVSMIKLLDKNLCPKN